MKNNELPRFDPDGDMLIDEENYETKAYRKVIGKEEWKY